MKAVADTLAVARSNLIERVSRRAKSRSQRCCRARCLPPTAFPRTQQMAIPVGESAPVILAGSSPSMKCWPNGHIRSEGCASRAAFGKQS
jgi:hypothetical protein